MCIRDRYTAAAVSGSGLHTRDSGQVAQISGRYVRVYASSGDGSYYVSEVQVFANQDVEATWTCEGAPFSAQGVPWSGAPSLDAAVVQAACTSRSDTCSASHPT